MHFEVVTSSNDGIRFKVSMFFDVGTYFEVGTILEVNTIFEVGTSLKVGTSLEVGTTFEASTSIEVGTGCPQKIGPQFLLNFSGYKHARRLGHDSLERWDP